MDGTTKLAMNYTDLPLAFHEVVRGMDAMTITVRPLRRAPASGKNAP